MMQAAYALTRLVLFGFGWSIATVLALAAEEMLPGVKWPILGLAAALWTFVYALYVTGEANRIGAASSVSSLPKEMPARSAGSRTGDESSSLRGA
jgi:di/tricarboxylate transporter